MVWWVRSDPCGIFSANLTIALVLFAWVVICKVILYPWYGVGLHMVNFTFICIMALISHCRAQFTDPGTIPKKYSEKVSPSELPAVEEVNYSEEPHRRRVPRLCRRCMTVKPPSAHHCSSCARCVLRMDHHCPWVNNCVAIFNQKYFLNFLFWTAFSCVYAGSLLIARFISCSGGRRTRGLYSSGAQKCPIGGAGVACSIITFVEALIFGLFTTIMLFDQLSAIFEGVPGIDAMQGVRGPKKPRMEALREVFGESFSWRWFFPTSLPREVFDNYTQQLRYAESVRRVVVKQMQVQEEQRRKLEAAEAAQGSPAVDRDPLVAPRRRDRNAQSHEQHGHSHSHGSGGHSHQHGGASYAELK